MKVFTGLVRQRVGEPEEDRVCVRDIVIDEDALGDTVTECVGLKEALELALSPPAPPGFIVPTGFKRRLNIPFGANTFSLSTLNGAECRPDIDDRVATAALTLEEGCADNGGECEDPGVTNIVKL